MSELAAAVSRAARTARLHELAADWSPELAAKLTQRMPGESVAEAVAGLDSPAPMFAALAPHVAPESLVRAARTVRRPRARASSLGALLGVALECLPEVLALARQFDGSERVFALVDGFPHLSAKLQATVLPELGPGLARAGYAAQRIARGVRPEAFRVAWDVFASAHPTDVTSASILTAAAPPHERAALRASLIHRVVAGGDLAYSAIGELLPHASGSDRTALVERSFEYPGRYGASTIARALGDAIVEPAIEARYLAFLDAGTQDYPWDLACAYADVAARDTPNRAHCIARATAFLDRMLDASIAGANPSPMMAEAGRIPTALEHQVNALLAVANALLQGEPRAHREQQVIEWLRRMCPEHSREDLVPIAWVRTTRLAPELHGAVLEAVSTIEEDAAAFDALAQIMAAAPPLEAAALDLVVARIERHAFPGLPSAPQVAAPPIAMVPSGRARRIATPEEIERALSSRMVAWRIVEVARLASEAAATALPAIEDPIVALVANILLLDAPAEGASAKLAALREDRKGWERYCRAAIALAPPARHRGPHRLDRDGARLRRRYVSAARCSTAGRRPRRRCLARDRSAGPACRRFRASHGGDRGRARERACRSCGRPDPRGARLRTAGAGAGAVRSDPHARAPRAPAERPRALHQPSGLVVDGRARAGDRLDRDARLRRRVRGARGGDVANYLRSADTTQLATVAGVPEVRIRNHGLGIGSAACWVAARMKHLLFALALAACDTHDQAATPAAKPVAPAAPAVTAKQLVGLPLHVDASEIWRLEPDPVTQGARLSTPDAEVSISKDQPGLKKTTLDDEKKRITGTPQDAKEEPLSDGWLWSYTVKPSVLPYNAVIYRKLGDAGYRCLVTANTVAQQVEGIAICKTLRP